jgi:hypothetical protein
MHHTTATRGHWLVAIGAIVIVGSTMLQWWQIGGGVGELPPLTGRGISEGRVFLMMFLPAVATLFLVTLPFASEKPIGIDHPISYLTLFAVVLGGYIWNILNLAQRQLVPWPPQHGVGFWFAAVGLVLFARGVFEVFEERRRRLY